MRKRISEQNFFPNFDLYTEYYKIEVLTFALMIGIYEELLLP